ncbi:MAG TPA: 6-phosphogluconolactonase [Longimicrobiaceae bacterium]
MNPLIGRIEEHSNPDELARAALESFRSIARDAVERRGRCVVALTGGSSPERLFRLLADPVLADEIPWERVHFFWGDERAVRPGHPRSNSRLADRLFIRPLALAGANVHRIHGELGARRAAERYEAELHRFFGEHPRFDLVHLGLGDDGHVASLFPFDATTLHERVRLALPALHPALGEWRVTLTYPVLRAARHIEFLVPSSAKARVLRRAMYGPLDPIRIPAQGVRPRHGDLLWRVTSEVLAAARAGD